MTDTEKQVIKAAAVAYGVDEGDITPQTDIREELSNQSMKMIVMISGIEDSLDVTIDLRDAAELKTIADFARRADELAAEK